MTTDTYISDEMLAVALEAYRLAYPERSLAGAQGMRTALEAAYSLIAKAERERCAEVVDERAKKARLVVGADAVGQLEGAADDIRAAKEEV